MRLVALAMIAVLAGGCEDEKDTPERAQSKEECRRLEEHIFRITPRPGGGSPETDPERIAQRMAKVPIEDIEQCAAVKDRTRIACMKAAPDVAALRACVPAAAE